MSNVRPRCHLTRREDIVLQILVASRRVPASIVLHRFSIADPFGGRTTLVLSTLHPKRDCGPKSFIVSQERRKRAADVSRRLDELGIDSDRENSPMTAGFVSCSFCSSCKEQTRRVARVRGVAIVPGYLGNDARAASGCTPRLAVLADSPSCGNTLPATRGGMPATPRMLTTSRSRQAERITRRIQREGEHLHSLVVSPHVAVICMPQARHS